MINGMTIEDILPLESARPDIRWTASPLEMRTLFLKVYMSAHDRRAIPCVRCKLLVNNPKGAFSVENVEYTSPAER